MYGVAGAIQGAPWNQCASESGGRAFRCWPQADTLAGGPAGHVFHFVFEGVAALLYGAATGIEAADPDRNGSTDWADAALCEYIANWQSSALPYDSHCTGKYFGGCGGRGSCPAEEEGRCIFRQACCKRWQGIEKNAGNRIYQNPGGAGAAFFETACLLQNLQAGESGKTGSATYSVPDGQKAACALSGKKRCLFWHSAEWQYGFKAGWNVAAGFSADSR